MRVRSYIQSEEFRRPYPIGLGLEQRVFSSIQARSASIASHFLIMIPTEARITDFSLYPKSHDLAIIETLKGGKITLKCSFLAYPESSLDVVWLVDYNHRSAAFNNKFHHQSHQSHTGEPPVISGGAGTNPGLPAGLGRLPVEERFIVLYDSKLHRGNSSGATSEQADSTGIYDNKQQSREKYFTISEISLYASRILIRETRSINEGESIIKESRIIIQSAHVDDSAR